MRIYPGTAPPKLKIFDSAPTEAILKVGFAYHRGKINLITVLLMISTDVVLLVDTGLMVQK
jgi:hypothetical protein